MIEKEGVTNVMKGIHTIRNDSGLVLNKSLFYFDISKISDIFEVQNKTNNKNTKNMSKYRFKTKEEFIRDGQWDYDNNIPIGWVISGEMNHFFGTDVPKEMNEKCDEGRYLNIDGWRFFYEDYVLKEESKNWAEWVPKKEINANGFEYFGDTLMEVSYDKKTWETRVVFGKKNGLYLAWAGADSIKNAKHEANSVSWKYARRIKTKLTIQEIADKFGLNKDEIEII